MSLPLVSDDLWQAIEPLLPTERPKPKGGRPRVPDHAALAGIIFVLRTGTPWLLGCHRLGVRDERRGDVLRGLLHLACTLICLAYLD